MSQAPPTDEFIFDEYKQGRGRKKKDIRMKRKDFFNEHQRLIALLGKTADKLGSEAKDQYKEMMSYRKKGKGTTFSKSKKDDKTTVITPRTAITKLQLRVAEMQKIIDKFTPYGFNEYLQNRRKSMEALSDKQIEDIANNPHRIRFDPKYMPYVNKMYNIHRENSLRKFPETFAGQVVAKAKEQIEKDNKLIRQYGLMTLKKNIESKRVAKLAEEEAQRRLRDTDLLMELYNIQRSVNKPLQDAVDDLRVQDVDDADAGEDRKSSANGKPIKGGIRKGDANCDNDEDPITYIDFNDDTDVLVINGRCYEPTSILGIVELDLQNGRKPRDPITRVELTDAQINQILGYRPRLTKRSANCENDADPITYNDFNDDSPVIVINGRCYEPSSLLGVIERDLQNGRRPRDPATRIELNDNEISQVLEYSDNELGINNNLRRIQINNDLRRLRENERIRNRDEEVVIDLDDDIPNQLVEPLQVDNEPEPFRPEEQNRLNRNRRRRREANRRVANDPNARRRLFDDEALDMPPREDDFPVLNPIRFPLNFGNLFDDDELPDENPAPRQRRRDGQGRKVGGSVVDSFINAFNTVKELHSVIDSFSDFLSDNQKSYFKNFTNMLNSVGKTVKDIEKMKQYVKYAKSLVGNIYSTIRSKDLSASDKFSSIVESIGKNIPHYESEDRELLEKTLQNITDDSLDDDDYKMSEEWKARMRQQGTYPRLSPVEEGNEVAEQDVGEDAVERPSKRQKLGEGKPNYALHTVVIHKPIDLEEARRLSRNFIKGRKKAHTENEQSYRFRNIPKTQFKPRSLRTKVVNPQISLIYGELKDGSKYIGSGIGDFFSKWISNVGKMAKGAITGNLGEVVEGTTGLFKDAYDTIREGVSPKQQPKIYDPSRVKKGKGVIGDLYKKAKEKVKKAKERFRVNPFSLGVLNNNYCGPGTQLEGQPALSATDSICKTHDYAYNEVKKAKEQGATKEQLARMTRDADNAMLESLKGVKESSWGDKFIHLASTLGISGKVLAEDIGLLDPTKFSASGKGQICSATGKKQCLCHLTGKGFTEKLANWTYKNIILPYFKFLKNHPPQKGYGATVSKPSAINIDEIGDKHRQLYDKYSNLFANEKDEKRSKDYLGALNSLDKTHLTQQQLKELEDYNYLYKTISGGAPPRLEGGFMGEIMGEMMTQMFEKGLHKGLDYVQNNPAKVIDFLGKLK